MHHKSQFFKSYRASSIGSGLFLRPRGFKKAGEVLLMEARRKGREMRYLKISRDAVSFIGVIVIPRQVGRVAVSQGTERDGGTIS